MLGRPSHGVACIIHLIDHCIKQGCRLEFSSICKSLHIRENPIDITSITPSNNYDFINFIWIIPCGNNKGFECRQFSHNLILPPN